MQKVLLLLLVVIVGCNSEDITQHWKCGDGSYKATKEECYSNVCAEDNDCTIATYKGLCGDEKGVFPNRIIPPEFESKRCNNEQCSIQMPECVRLPSLILAKCKDEKCVEVEKDKIRIKLDGRNIAAFVAETEEERADGLMFVPHLGDDEGMLFVFDKPTIPSFWMKNVFIPLEIIFINENKEIVSIEHAEPCKSEPCKLFSPPKEIAFALEVNVGGIERLKIGEKVNWD